MPQLDFTIASSQIFWSIITFFVLYIILTHFFLPNFIKVLKARKKILLENNIKLLKLKKSLATKQNILNKNIDLNLIKIKTLIEKEMLVFFKTFSLIDLKFLNKNIARVLYFNSIAYDTNILKSIQLKIVF